MGAHFVTLDLELAITDCRSVIDGNRFFPLRSSTNLVSCILDSSIFKYQSRSQYIVAIAVCIEFTHVRIVVRAKTAVQLHLSCNLAFFVLELKLRKSAVSL